MACQHENFQCDCQIGRLLHKDGGAVTGYTADIKVKCVDCGVSFRFVGLPAGNHHSEPRVSVDGIELRAPIEPATHEKFLLSASYSIRPPARQ